MLSAECTHNHPEGIKGALAVTDCIWYALNGYNKAQIKKHIIEAYDYDLHLSCDYIRDHNSFNETCQVTVPQAIIAFLESDSFDNASRLAVSIGGDSDTIGAITGSIAQAFYGIPESIEDPAIQYLPDEFIQVFFISNIILKKPGDFCFY